MLQLHKAEISFGKKEVLKDISFELKTGEILGIFGRNGCGKSTLLKMIFGSLSTGEIKLSIDNIEISPAEVIQKQLIAYIPQHPFLPKNVKVRDIIPMYFSEEKKQDAIFYDPGVAKITHQRTGDLSQGERKYFETLLVANLDQPFLMLDEPFSMLEPLQTEALKEFLLQKKEKGIIITDHYYNDVLNITSKNLVIENGNSYTINSPDDLVKYNYLKR